MSSRSRCARRRENSVGSGRRSPGPASRPKEVEGVPSVLRDWLVRLFRVPAEPAAPAGDDVRVFRASPRYFGLKLLVWIGGAVGAPGGDSIGITPGGGPVYGCGGAA